MVKPAFVHFNCSFVIIEFVMKSNLSSSPILLILFLSSFASALPQGPSNTFESTFSASTQEALGQTSQKVLIAPEDMAAVSCGSPSELTVAKVPYRVAMGIKDFKGLSNTEMCGKCVKITGSKGSVTAAVVSTCGNECVPGTIKLNKKAADLIGVGVPDKFPVKWEETPCPNGPLLTSPPEPAAASSPVPPPAAGTSLVVNPVIAILNFQHCPGGQGAATTVESLNEIIFGTPDPNSASVQRACQFCSRGKVVISKDVSRILEIKPPCELFEEFKCALPRDSTPMEKFLAKELANLGDDLKRYDQRWFLLDKHQQCQFAGLAYLGREYSYDGVLTGRMVMDPYSWMFTSVWFHEFGHILNVHHANSLVGSRVTLENTSEYSDKSSSMGAPDWQEDNNYPCFNLAHMASLGWASPRKLDRLELNGVFKQYNIGFNDKDPESGLEINDDMNPMFEWFVSIRNNENSFYTDRIQQAQSPYPNDDGMSVEFADNVHFHKLDMNPSMGPNATMLMSMMQPGQEYRSPEARLIVRYISYNPGFGATVQVCSFSNGATCDNAQVIIG